MRDSERACQVAERVAEKIRDVTRVAYDAEPSRPTQARNSGRAEHCWVWLGATEGMVKSTPCTPTCTLFRWRRGFGPSLFFLIATITLMAAVPRVLQRILTRVPWQPKGTVFTFP